MAGAGWRQWTRERLSQTLLQTYIQDQVVQRWVSFAARAAGLAAPSQGMVTYRDDLDGIEYRTVTGTWQRLQAATGWVTVFDGPGNYDQAATAAWVSLPSMEATINVPEGRKVELELQVPNLEAPVSGGVFIRVVIGGTVVRSGRVATNGATGLTMPARISGSRAYTAAATGVLLQAQLFGAGGGGWVRGDSNTGPLFRYRIV